MDFFDPTFDTTAIFGEVGALVFVIDSQVSYSRQEWVLPELNFSKETGA